MSQSFQELLDQNHSWPCQYQFKVVVPATKASDLETAFQSHPFRIRDSRSGKYKSYTFTVQADNAQHVISLYDAAKKIPGAILL